jgi:hypothetical protein
LKKKHCLFIFLTIILSFKRLNIIHKARIPIMKRASLFPILLIYFWVISFYSCVPYENSPEEYVIWKPALSFPKGLTHAKEINGKLYAASETGIYNDATLWSINNFNDLSRFLPGEIVFRLPISGINDNIILFEGASIYRLSMNDQAIRLTKLDNVGLEDTGITSVNLIFNSTVFVTSTCFGGREKCGGFYKPLDKFFTQKNF